jgi:hypothetical protein
VRIQSVLRCNPMLANLHGLQAEAGCDTPI